MKKPCHSKIGSAAEYLPISLGGEEVPLRQALREIAGEADKIQIAVQEASRRCGLPYWRTYDIWYGKARRVEDDEHAAIAAALQHKRKKATRNELQELYARLARLEARVAAEDADYRREVPARMRAAFS